MTLFHPYIWVLIHANIVLICRIQVHVKYASNTHQIRNQIQANMGVLGARPWWAEYMSNTHRIRNQYKQIWVYLAHVKYASNTQANTIKYGCTWRWVEYTSNVHQIRKQIQANMGVIGVRPWWAEYTSNIHQILKWIQANTGVFGARSRSTRIYYDIWRVLTVFEPEVEVRVFERIFDVYLLYLSTQAKYAYLMCIW